MKRRILNSAPRPVKAARTATALVLAAGALSACSVFSQHATVVPYDPAEGVSANLEGVDVRDLMIVGQDGKGVISGAFSNTTAKPVNVTVKAEGGSATISVPPHGMANIVEKATSIQIKGKPGTTEQLAISTDANANATLTVPIIAPLGAYSTVTPNAESSSSSSSATSTESATASPSGS